MGKLLKIKEAAEQTSMQESTWRAWVLHRRVTFVKLGRAVRIPEGAVAKMIADGTVPAREDRRA
jgi:excisionase family DNA binding protein